MKDLKTFKLILEQEIEWCEKNKETVVDKEFTSGFVEGVKQAQRLLIKLIQLNSD